MYNREKKSFEQLRYTHTGLVVFTDWESALWKEKGHDYVIKHSYQDDVHTGTELKLHRQP